LMTKIPIAGKRMVLFLFILLFFWISPQLMGISQTQMKWISSSPFQAMLRNQVFPPNENIKCKHIKTSKENKLCTTSTISFNQVLNIDPTAEDETYILTKPFQKVFIFFLPLIFISRTFFSWI
jgi:hypothetical protein